MFIPMWALILISLVVVIGSFSMHRQIKQWKYLAIRNYRQWGLMRHEFECLSNGVMCLIGGLSEYPELIKSIEKKLGEYTILRSLSKWKDAYDERDVVLSYRKVREIIYEHWSKYDYLDVEQDMNYFGFFRSE
ncbi:MAG TPA: hypothetical protein DGS69_06755 [Acinetobacter baumannii]|nr:hypothetical protein [Acinetobacter baumannii]